jgi:tetratricopeptide (TPR) repeat protein
MSSRLWPVLGVLVLLIGVAAALEVLARGRDAATLVVAIRTDSPAGLPDDDGDGIQADDATGALAPLDDNHARARVLARRGQLVEAIALFEQVASSHPDNAALRAEIGYWMLSAGSAEQARVELERAARMLPEDPHIALNLGIAAARLADDAGAEREYRRALGLRPAFGAARVALAALLLRRGAVDEAMAVIRPATSSGGNEDRGRALVVLGRAQLAAGRPAEAERSFAQAIERAPALVELRVRIARAWLSTGKREDAARAVEALRRASALAPDVPQVYSALGRALEATDDVAGAREAYERALRLDPDYRYARRRLLRIALDSRDYRAARMHAERLLADAPEVAEHHFLAGLVASRDGRLDEARAQYRDAIAKEGGRYPEAWFNLGRLEKHAGELDAAIADYRKALEIRPDYIEAMNNIGLAYAAAGRQADAEAAYRSALALDPRYAAGWLNLGELLSGAGRFDEAVAALGQAIVSRDGDYPAAQLDLGVAQGRAGRTEAAISVYRAIIERHPSYAAAWSNLGLVLEDAGRGQEAMDAYRQAFGVDEERLDALKHLAALQAKSGQATDAIATCEELLERDPSDNPTRLVLGDFYRRAGNLAACAQQAAAVLAADSTDGTARELAAKCSAAATADVGDGSP